MSEITNGQVEQLAVFDSILRVLDGEDVSDFFMSFWPVRRVWDLMQIEKQYIEIAMTETHARSSAE